MAISSHKTSNQFIIILSIEVFCTDFLGHGKKPENKEMQIMFKYLVFSSIDTGECDKTHKQIIDD